MVKAVGEEVGLWWTRPRRKGASRARVPQCHPCGVDRHRRWSEPTLVPKALRGPADYQDTGPFHHVVWLLGSQTLVGIHQFPDPHGSEPFDERQPGLDHLAFACANRAELEQWESKLNELGIENGGIIDAAYRWASPFATPTTSLWSSSLHTVGDEAGVVVHWKSLARTRPALTSYGLGCLTNGPGHHEEEDDES